MGGGGGERVHFLGVVDLFALLFYLVTNLLRHACV